MTGIVAQNVGRTSGLIKSAGGGGGVWTLIKTLTASADGTLDFVDGTDDVVLDSTYPIYVFKFINIHSSASDTNFTFQVNVAGGADYNETVTSTYFRSYHNEGGSTAALSYETGNDQHQGTSFIELIDAFGTDNDQSMCGELMLFNPGSTTFAKQFIGKCHNYHLSDYSLTVFTAGYFNLTAAIDEVQFKMGSGNIDAGKIKLYGIKDS